jgi:predicted TPR repeat methyltransferase
MSFEVVPPALLRKIAAESPVTDKVRTPRLYSHPIAFVRRWFWARLRVIHQSIVHTVPAPRRVAIDFGCGGGVFLPALANTCELVQGIDIAASEAERLIRHYGLTNVRLIDADIYNMDNTRIEPADIIVAADVLEHFEDLGPPARRLRDWLKDDGYLFTSGPSENFLTRLGRALGGIQKPWDHYHTGYEVEAFLESHGFEKLQSRHVYRLLPMYILSVWKKRRERDIGS